MRPASKSEAAHANHANPTQRVLREGRCLLPLNSCFKMIQLTDLQHHELIGRGGHPRHVRHLAASSGASRRGRVWQDVFDPTDWWKEAVVSLGTFPHGRLHLLGAVATYWRVPGAKQASSLIKLVQGYAHLIEEQTATPNWMMISNFKLPAVPYD